MTASRLAAAVLRGCRSGVSPAAATARAPRARSRSPTAGCRSCRSPRSAATLEVPENRDRPDGRKITLVRRGAARQHAESADADPLFILAGGPGPGGAPPRRPSPRR